MWRARTSSNRQPYRPLGPVYAGRTQAATRRLFTRSHRVTVSALCPWRRSSTGCATAAKAFSRESRPIAQEPACRGCSVLAPHRGRRIRWPAGFAGNGGRRSSTSRGRRRSRQGWRPRGAAPGTAARPVPVENLDCLRAHDSDATCGPRTRGRRFRDGRVLFAVDVRPYGGEPCKTRKRQSTVPRSVLFLQARSSARPTARTYEGAQIAGSWPSVAQDGGFAPHEEMTFMDMGNPLLARTGTGLIDVHAHCFPAPVLQREAVEAGYRAGNFLAPPAASWSPEEAVEFMDARGIQLQLLSMPVALDTEGRAPCERLHGGDRRRTPRPLRPSRQHPLGRPRSSRSRSRKGSGRAERGRLCPAQQLRRALLGDPRFDEVFAELSRRNATVFLHPESPADTRLPPAGAPGRWSSSPSTPRGP